MYIVIDLTTGEVVEKTNNQKKAELVCQTLEDMSAYVYGIVHEYMYTLENTLAK